ncbi:lachesin-like isoform X1 [Aphis gossypii]|uniref:lachesin-like isoform X1 n=1 Tax=Aphis gossypii TaxID=80765 RepID=UPI002158E34C|nr:lachesin-like isoform X1 [Aphis gossypii]
MNNIYAVLLLLNINIAYSQKRPYITHITQRLEIDVGGEIDLDCSTRHSREHNVLWVKIAKDQINGSIELVGSTLIVKDPTVSLITQIKQDSSRYIIHIHSFQDEDASVIYRCDLNVKISANSTKSLGVEEAQSSFIIGCFAGGYPYPRVFWRKPNNPFLSIGNALDFPSLKKKDRGNYYCIAENGVRNDTSRKVSIDVEFPPVVTASPTRVGQGVNYDVYLVCRVEANPLPSITWIFKGLELSNNQHYWISSFATADDKMDSTLLIKIKNYLYGDYICKASNILGAAEITITVYKTLYPQCHPHCED